MVTITNPRPMRYETSDGQLFTNKCGRFWPVARRNRTGFLCIAVAESAEQAKRIMLNVSNNPSLESK